MKSIKVIIAIITVVGILFGFAACSWAEQYPRVFMITRIDRINRILYLHDYTGNEWLMKGDDDWAEDDLVAAIMDDNNTSDNITDDSIIEIRYNGQIGW